MSLPIILLTILAIATAILFSVLRVTHGGVVSLLTKTLASFCFVVLGVVVAFSNQTVDVAMYVVLGLISGMIGDILLDLKSVDQTRGNSYINYGMFAFGVGHVFYVIFAGLFVGKSVTTELLIAGAIALTFTAVVVFFSNKLLGLTLGKFLVQASIYAFFLTFAAVFAVALSITTPAILPFAIALVCFWASDLVLSLMYFGGRENSIVLSLTNHVLYYGAQIVIALFVAII